MTTPEAMVQALPQILAAQQTHTIETMAGLQCVAYTATLFDPYNVGGVPLLHAVARVGRVVASARATVGAGVRGGPDLVAGALGQQAVAWFVVVCPCRSCPPKTTMAGLQRQFRASMQAMVAGMKGAGER